MSSSSHHGSRSSAKKVVRRGPHNSSVTFSSVSYPMLPTSEIVQCLRELGMEGLTEEEIKDPQRDRDKMKEVLFFLLSNCQGFDDEGGFDMPEAAAALKKNMAGAASSSSSPSSSSSAAAAQQDLLPDELHTRAWSNIAFFKTLQKVLARCGYNDFGLRDLVKPEKGRFLRQLCAMIAFLKFQELPLAIFRGLSQTREQIIAGIAQAEADILELSAQEKELKSQQPGLVEAYDDCQRDCLQLENEMKRLTQVNSKLRTELEQLNRTKAKLKDDVEGAELSVEECGAELHKWKSRLVQSPERKKQGIVHKTQLLEVIKSEVRELEQQWNDTKAAKHRRNDVCHKLEALPFDALIEVATASQKAAQTNREEQQKVVASEQQALQDATNVTKAEREYQRQNDHCAGERKRLELQLAAAHENHDTVLDQLLRLEKDRRDVMARTEKEEREVAALTAQLDEEKRQADETIRHMVSQYRVQERAWKSRLQTQMSELGVVGGPEE